MMIEEKSMLNHLMNAVETQLFRYEKNQQNSLIKLSGLRWLDHFTTVSAALHEDFKLILSRIFEASSVIVADIKCHRPLANYLVNWIFYFKCLAHHQV